ncbi:IS630 family transposase [Streptomyces sp. HC307]|uniref:IS630 family transposase n=1 Tax=Streptomyces flavusporus TaxID=3385496 RepID=UPI0039172FB0
MDLSSEQIAELRELAGSRHVPAVVALRARVVLWSAEGRRRKGIAELAGVAPLTVDRCKSRYAERGVAGLEDKRRGGPRTQVPPRVRARVIALTRMSPPADSGLSHWSTRTLADHLKRREGISVSWHYVARIWREENLKPHRSGTFKISKDPAFAEKVADIVGLYLAPPGGAVVLSVDEKTQVQALDRTQPVLPVAFAATEQRTHDYVRHGTTNLFAALNVATGEVLGECKPSRNGANFLAFLKKAVKPHAGKEIHVVLDNLSTHTTPGVKAWLAKNPHVHFHFTPVGSSWLNQIVRHESRLRRADSPKEDRLMSKV